MHTRELLAANNTTGNACGESRQVGQASHASASIKHASRESIWSLWSVQLQHQAAVGDDRESVDEPMNKTKREPGQWQASKKRMLALPATMHARTNWALCIACQWVLHRPVGIWLGRPVATAQDGWLQLHLYTSCNLDRQPIATSVVHKLQLWW